MPVNKLYPPIIADTIPAFYTRDGEGTIIIPFGMNQTVSKNDIKGFALKIKTMSSGDTLSIIKYVMDSAEIERSILNSKIEFTIRDTSYSGEEEEIEINNYFEFYKAQANEDINKFFEEFTTSESNVSTSYIGTYFKFQLAYLYKETEEEQDYSIGYYSNAAAGKLTSYPENLEITSVNAILPNENNDYRIETYFTGETEIKTFYKQINDPIEKIYSSHLEFFDKDSEDLIYMTEEKMHNSSYDTLINEAEESFNLDYDFVSDNEYFYTCRWVVTTINGMVVESMPIQIIFKENTEECETISGINVENNMENGYNEIKIQWKNKTLEDRHNYKIFRKDSNNGWRNIYSFCASGDLVDTVYKDFSIEQGNNYYYAIQEFDLKDNFKPITKKIQTNNSVYADFDHVFLTDGERQLKIKYNPKISTFRSNKQEKKIDTIGGKFPFIFTNNQIDYKEFPIEGLISFLSDEENLFLYDNNIGNKLKRDSTISLIHCEESEFSSAINKYTTKKEREFKLEVLKWLNNGKEKLFRSSQEGNYIIRILNVTLNSNDTLGRYLHSFQGTAYEVSECNYQNLIKIGIINPELDMVTYNKKFIEIGGN